MPNGDCPFGNPGCFHGPPDWANDKAHYPEEECPAQNKKCRCCRKCRKQCLESQTEKAQRWRSIAVTIPPHMRAPGSKGSK